jgi:hypothetical protein
MTYFTGLSVNALMSSTRARAAAGVVSESMMTASFSVMTMGEFAPVFMVPEAVA